MSLRLCGGAVFICREIFFCKLKKYGLTPLIISRTYESTKFSSKLCKYKQKILHFIDIFSYIAYNVIEAFRITAGVNISL